MQLEIHSVSFQDRVMINSLTHGARLSFSALMILIFATSNNTEDTKMDKKIVVIIIK
jgi:hypothetical protein